MFSNRSCCGALWALGIFLGPLGVHPPANAQEFQSVHAVRVAKASLLVKAFYHYEDRSSFEPYVEYLVQTHEDLEVEHGPAAHGYGDAWYYSLVYGAANFGLRCFATASGWCAGPMDVKHRPYVLEPQANIRHHCLEMLGFYKDGVRGRNLCEHVFYPAAPHDWGYRGLSRKERAYLGKPPGWRGGRFAIVDAKFQARIKLAYQQGELPHVATPSVGPVVSEADGDGTGVGGSSAPTTGGIPESSRGDGPDG